MVVYSFSKSNPRAASGYGLKKSSTGRFQATADRSGRVVSQYRRSRLPTVPEALTMLVVLGGVCYASTVACRSVRLHSMNDRSGMGFDHYAAAAMCAPARPSLAPPVT